MQDKYEYLRMIPEITLQTLKIPITIASDEENLKTTELVEEFLDNGYHEDSGWVLKLPFTNNSHGVRFSKTKERVISLIECLKGFSLF